mmetsp:Transcript_32795/g.50064  ORF Transcript_32795/g.50064 Transcript_32795/m.50064 type:complete len:141 (+) Transcript_32795:233-655(+)
MTNQSSDFGGYLDILVDFTVYGLIPVGVTAGSPTQGRWIMCGIMLTSFFVNSAGLFMLSSLIEKNKHVSLKYKDELQKKKEQDRVKELTSAKMPPALMEGFESMVLFGLIILFPDYQVAWYSIFSAGVTVTILQRVNWAK